MARYGMLIDTRRCIGCYACRAACQNQNKISAEVTFIKYHFFEKGDYGNLTVETVPTQCMHCDDAPCAQVCPTGATYITDVGTVLIDDERCIGCKYCAAACPYDARVQIHETGVIDKCRLCTQYVPYTDESTAMTTCVTACPTGVRIFGDLDDPNSELSLAIAETGAQPIAGDLTKAKLYYVR